jgi:hypothetical protein
MNRRRKEMINRYIICCCDRHKKRSLLYLNVYRSLDRTHRSRSYSENQTNDLFKITTEQVSHI